MTTRLQSAGAMLLASALLAASLPCAHAATRSNAARARKLYLDGVRALAAKNYTRADADFTSAVQLEPDNADYRAAETILTGHRAARLIAEADKASLQGRQAEARADLLAAYKLDPKSPMIAQHINQIADAAAPTPVDLHPQDSTLAPPVTLAPTTGRHTFHLHEGAVETLRQVLGAYGIHPAIDSSVRDFMVRFNAEDVTFAQAARLVQLATGTFFVPLDPARTLVAADTPENREKFQRLAEETIYLPGLEPSEIKDLSLVAHNVFKAQRVATSAAHSTMTVRAPASELNALNGTLRELLNGRSMVQIDVRLYNIGKTKSRNLGVQLPQQTVLFNIPSELNSFIQQNQSLVDQIISSGLASPGDIGAIALALLASGEVTGTSILSQPFAYFGGGLTLTGLSTGSVTGNLALNSSVTQVIDQVTLRLLNREQSTIRSGERYPIITSKYSNFGSSSLGLAGLSSSGLSSELASLGITASELESGLSETIPQVQYQDLGLTLVVRPFIQADHDVTLDLQLKITSLQGTSLNGLPVLNSQQYATITTLKPGASAMLVSDLSKQQSRAVTGVPGLSDLPGFQSSTNQNTQYNYSDLVLVLTPHIIRLAHHAEAGKMFIFPAH